MKVVFKTKYLLKSDFESIKKNKQDFSLSDKLDYLTRKEAKVDDKFKKQKGYLTRNGTKEQNIFNQTKNKKDKPIYYYDKTGVVCEADKIKRKYNISKLNDLENKDNFCLYQSFVSFSKEMSTEIQSKYTEEECYQMLERHLKIFLVDNNFDLDNTEYFLSNHSNTDNFHCHIDYFETVPTREKNNLKKNTFEKFKKNLINEIQEPEIKVLKRRLEKELMLATKENKIFDDPEILKDIKKNHQKYYGNIQNDKVKDYVDKYLEDNIIYTDEYKKYIEAEEEYFNYSKNIVGEEKAMINKENKINRLNITLKNDIYNNLKEEAFDLERSNVVFFKKRKLRNYKLENMLKREAREVEYSLAQSKYKLYQET